MTDPDDIQSLLDEAEGALDRGDPGEAVGYCEQALAADPGRADAWMLAGEAYRDLNQPELAEQAYRRALALDVGLAPTAWAALAGLLFEVLRFEESRGAALRAIRLDAANPEGYHWRAMLRERRGDYRGARRDFVRANRLDPIGFPTPRELDDETIEAIVEETVEALHPAIQDYLQNVAILVEEVPDEDLCRQWDPPASPADLYGYFSGQSLRERHDGPSLAMEPGSMGWSALPPSIVLFRRNLSRISHDRERVIEELRITVFHEIGHFLGLSEEDLEDRGLE